MKKTIAALAATTALVASGAYAATGKNVDLVFVIDDSGSMSDEGATLAARIGEVMTGIALDAAIDTVHAGVISYTDSPTLVSAITDDATALNTAISGISYGGAEEDGLQAMASVLPGGSLVGDIGWRPNTVRSLVLLTDEDSDDTLGEGDGYVGDLAGYTAFGNMLKNLGYLNNIIVSNGGTEYGPTANPTGAEFSLVDFVVSTNTFLEGFIKAKIGEIIIPPPTGTPVVPVPAAGWLLLGGLGGLAAMRRKKS